MPGSRSESGLIDSRLGAGASAKADRQRKTVRNSIRSERHYRDTRSGYGIRLADIQRTYRHRRRSNRSQAAPAGSDSPRQDAYDSVRVSYAGADAQPAQSAAHTRRKL